MPKTKRWLETALAEAEKTAVKLPFTRGNRRPIWQRDAATQQPAMKKAASA